MNRKVAVGSGSGDLKWMLGERADGHDKVAPASDPQQGQIALAITAIPLSLLFAYGLFHLILFLIFP